MDTLKNVPLEEELKKNPKLRIEDLESLSEWCNKQPHLPKPTYSELVIFLHCNYYLMEPTKNTIEAFYTSRTHIEFFNSRDPIGSKGLREAMKYAVVLPLKETTKEGYKVIYARILDPDPSHYVFNDVAKIFNMILDLFIFSEGTFEGHIILMDMQGLSLGHAARFSPLGLKKSLYYLQEAVPFRLKGFHISNSIPLVDILMGMMKPFMKKELMDMIHIHTTKESLAKKIPLEILPNECGGKAGPIEELRDAKIREVDEYRTWFLEEQAIRRVDESRRPGKGKTATDLFGAEGSFKKLDID